jgi:hypothetical protein
MKIVALDVGQSKSVACIYETGGPPNVASIPPSVDRISP